MCMIVLYVPWWLGCCLKVVVLGCLILVVNSVVEFTDLPV